MERPDLDLLLEYLSAARQGSWQSFKSAVNALYDACIPQTDSPRWAPTTIAQHLASLAHVEFAFDTTLDWTVVKPMLVGIRSAPTNSCILCGARTSKLVDDLVAAAAKFHVSVSRTRQDLAPSVIELKAVDERDLVLLAEHMAIPFERDAAHRLIRCLPNLESMYRASPEAPIPQGFEIARLDPETLLWQPLEKVQGDGAYSFSAYRPEYRIVDGGQIRRVTRSIAIYRALQRVGRFVIQYDSSSQSMRVPPQAPLPILYARAAVLCTGCIPDYEPATGQLIFSWVSKQFALALMQGIEQWKDI